MNPADPWAWAGLAGDAVDMIPFVGGIGETIKVMSVSSKVAKNADNVIDAAKALRRSTDASSNLRKATGSYEILFASGKNYVGKGGFQRAIDSAKRYSNPHALTYNKIWSPGRKY